MGQFLFQVHLSWLCWFSFSYPCRTCRAFTNIYWLIKFNWFCGFQFYRYCSPFYRKPHTPKHGSKVYLVLYMLLLPGFLKVCVLAFQIWEKIVDVEISVYYIAVLGLSLLTEHMTHLPVPSPCRTLCSELFSMSAFKCGSSLDFRILLVREWEKDMSLLWFQQQVCCCSALLKKNSRK